MAKKKKHTVAKRKRTIQLKGAPAWYEQQRLHMILFFTLGFLLYANTFGHQYAQDDAIVITDNVFTQEGFRGIGGILQYDTFYGFFQDAGKATLVAGGRYRPLSLITFAIEYAIFGQNPTVSHIINALFFGTTAVLLYLVLLQFLADKKYNRSRYFITLAATLIFVTHPIHTEAVANIKGRDEILALLGSLGALYFAFVGFRQKNWTRHILGALCLFLGLLSKENAITFVAIIPLSLYFFAQAKPGEYLKASLPYLAAAFLFILIRSSILALSLGDPSGELMNNPFLEYQNGQYVAIGFGAKMATVIYTLGKYVQLLFFPHPLTHDYYPRHIEIMSWGDPLVLLSLVFYLGMVAYAIRGLFRKDLLAYGILFYLITISLVSNIVFAIGTNLAERLLFMPSVGFSIALAVLLYRLARLINGRQEPSQFRQLFLPAVLLLLFCIGLSAKTISRNTAWKDNFTLFTTDIKTSKNSAKLRNAVGGELIAQYYDVADPALKESKLREAVGHLREAVRIHPTYKNAYLLMGNAHFYLNEFEPAIQAYQRALQLDPGYTEATRNLGLAYRDGGKFYGEQQGDLAKALQYLNQAVQYLPDDYETLRLLGVANGMGGNQAQAIEYFRRAAEANPESADAWYNLGTAHLAAGNAEQGQAFRQKAIQMDPEVVQRMGN
jgi:tetratricopeptide (TPR) repeat protein